MKKYDEWGFPEGEAMELLSVSDIDITNKTVLFRVDYDTPTDIIDGKKQVTDDTRIRLTLPTLKHLLKHNCKIIILAKHGRPDGKVIENLRLDPMAEKLTELSGQAVRKLDELTGSSVTQAVADMKPGEVVMLENTRFHPGEISEDPKLSKELSKLGDIIVNDAFSISHRSHASVTGIAKHLPMVAGFHLLEEVNTLSKLMTKPKRPFVAVIGGAKISDKVEAIRSLSQIADVVLVGGGVANNFLKAEGVEVYHSYLEDTVVDTKKKGVSFVAVAEELIEQTKTEKMMLNGYIPLPKIIYPSDVIVAERMKNPKKTAVVDLTNGDTNGKKNWMFLDIGPKTVKLYQDIISQAKTIFWNGPMGVFEQKEFEAGTKAIAKTAANSKATTIVGGGDTISAIHHFKLENKYNYVSAAGGASLEFLSGKVLPGIKPMLKK